MNQAPAYQMYAGDWLKSRSVRLMNDFQRGWYIQLLNEAWDGSPQCMLPNDDRMLQVLAGVSELAKSQPDFNERWTDVKRLFKDGGEYVYNERQLEELAKQNDKREKAVAAGNKSALARKKQREELESAKKDIVSRSSNGRSTDVQRTFNGRSTLQSSVSSLQSSDFISPPQPPKGGDARDEQPAKSTRFAKPTLEEVADYCRERKNAVDPEKFHDHYEAVGWKVGKNPMKDWKAAVRTWEKNNFRQPTQPRLIVDGSGAPPPSDKDDMGW